LVFKISRLPQRHGDQCGATFRVAIHDAERRATLIKSGRAGFIHRSRVLPSAQEASAAPLPYSRISTLLLKWFSRRARPLPWRQTSDPFAIWVSEVMLQQTQVVSVIPYYERFLRRFPTLTSLAQAEECDVLRLWEGLGYYRRARALHQAARALVAGHAGAIPNDPDVLAGLPGLGRYTINAILSQAFDRRVPILEANSRRVLCRLLGIEEDPRRADVDRLLWSTAAQLLPRRGGAGRFNQALMEIGALVCTPRRPQCESCPLTRYCRACQLGRQEHIPVRPPPPRIEEVDDLALVIRRKRQVLIVQRPGTGRWAGLWEFPHMEKRQGEGDSEPAHEETARRLLEAIGLEAELGAELMTIRHAVTRFRIRLVCFEALHRRGTFASDDFQQAAWVVPARLQDFPFSSPQRRLASVVSGTSGS